MTELDDFKALSPELQMSSIVYTILAQHARLRRGEDMIGPVALFKDGKHFQPDDLYPGRTDVAAVLAKTVKITPKQLATGHPHFDFNVNNENYFHMLDVKVSSRFRDTPVGTVLKTTYEGVDIPVALTQEMIDQESYILARFGLSV